MAEDRSLYVHARVRHGLFAVFADSGGKQVNAYSSVAAALEAAEAWWTHR